MSSLTWFLVACCDDQVTSFRVSLTHEAVVHQTMTPRPSVQILNYSYSMRISAWMKVYIVTFWSKIHTIFKRSAAAKIKFLYTQMQ